MKLSLKKIFPFLYKTQWVVKPEHETELAFTSNGVEYHCFTNGFNAYYERYMAAMDAINALEQRVSREYLKMHIGLTNEYLNKGDLSKIAILNKHLEERMSHLCNVDLLYQLASVWYFDKSENCYTFNPEYAEKKISEWRKDKEVLAFFLRSPLSQLMPLPDTFNTSMVQSYTKAQRIELMSHLKYHLSSFKETPSNQELISTIKSQITALENLLSQD